MRRIMLMLGFLAVVSISVNAQVRSQRVQTVKARALDLTQTVEAARLGVSRAAPDVAARIREAFSEKNDDDGERKLVGTWNVVVPGDPPFDALQTFNEDGTFVETSSLLATLTEGPAHGVWKSRRHGAILTFELFAFDPDGNEAGRIRVRNFIRLLDEDNFVAESAVDFIDLDENVIPEIATGTFTGKRMKLRGL